MEEDDDVLSLTCHTDDEDRLLGVVPTVSPKVTPSTSTGTSTVEIPASIKAPSRVKDVTSNVTVSK